MRFVWALCAVFGAACAAGAADMTQATKAPPAAGAAVPTTSSTTDARTFADDTEQRLLKLWIDQSRADWVKSTFITDDTEILAAEAADRTISATVKSAKEAARFDGVKADEATARKLKLLKLSLTLAAPADPAESAEVTRIATAMEGMYGKGKYCPDNSEDRCIDLEDITRIMAASRDAKQLLDVWAGWHTISRPMKRDYVRFVELANKGAREVGFKDTGAMWRSSYDMTPEAFEKDADRAWMQVKPLYDDLHCYVRAQLQKHYGKERVPDGAPIPAHLLGNMWAQEWTNVYPLVEPYKGVSSLDVTKALVDQKWDAIRMVKTGEAFFTSLGLPPLPKTFWERSMLTKPRDRDVVCHASAWDLDGDEDLRIKMCIKPEEEDLETIHHELGHNFYQRAYNKLPFLFRNGANDGFHEAIGDSIVLAMTPAYYKQLGLLNDIPANNQQALINLQLKQALTRVSFLPFGLLIDKWRWDVFSGKVQPADYNKAWWELRRKYQGIAPARARGEDDFDAGAKYHVPANVPYIRYFLARIYQFQFYRAMCQAAGFKGPLHECTFYGSKEAGARLAKMLELGQSKPWPDALQAMTGQRQLDGSAIVEYFAPLQSWLKEQNKGQKCGW